VSLTVPGLSAILRPLRVLSVIVLLTALILPTVAFAEIQTFTATHTYILGDHDSKDDARQRCLLETKRKILEQAGVYIESASEVKNLDLTNDKITSFAAAVMQVKDTKETVGFENGHMTLTLTTTAQVDLAEVRKQVASRQLDASMREDVAAQKERLKRLEAQLEGMQRQQSPGRVPTPPMSDISAEFLQTVQAQAAQGNARSQTALGMLYELGRGVPQDYVQAAKWYQKAAIQGNAMAQYDLGRLYLHGKGVPQDVAQSAMWYQKAAAQGYAPAQDDIGLAYFAGLGVPRDDVQARQWYEKAAAQGFVDAQFHLGTLYEHGWGAPKDYAQAVKWYEKAAEQGNLEAQLKLGDRYNYGQVVP
jgi:TPR repeat protein